MQLTAYGTGGVVRATATTTTTGAGATTTVTLNATVRLNQVTGIALTIGAAESRPPGRADRRNARYDRARLGAPTAPSDAVPGPGVGAVPGPASLGAGDDVPHRRDLRVPASTRFVSVG